MDKIYSFRFSRFLRVSKSDLGLAIILLLLAFIFSDWRPSLGLVLLAEIFFLLPLVFIINYIYTAIGIRFTILEDGTGMVYYNKLKDKTIEFSKKDIKTSECYRNTDAFQFMIASKYFYYRIHLTSGEEIILNCFVVDDLKNLFRDIEYKTVSFPFVL